MPPADHTRESRAAETASEARQNAALAPNLESVLAEAEKLSRSSVVHLFRADQRRRAGARRTDTGRDVSGAAAGRRRR